MKRLSKEITKGTSQKLIIGFLTSVYHSGSCYILSLKGEKYQACVVYLWLSSQISISGFRQVKEWLRAVHRVIPPFLTVAVKNTQPTAHEGSWATGDYPSFCPWWQLDTQTTRHLHTFMYLQPEIATYLPTTESNHVT